MARKILLFAQLAVTVLFIVSYKSISAGPVIAWAVPLSVLILIAINSVWFSRFTSWLIFAVAFFGLMTVLSAFTLRWRLQTGFEAAPFYRALAMYTIFVYISLGQIKILGGSSRVEPAQK